MNVLLLSMPDSFEHMPEIRSRYGYPLVLLGMIVIAGSMLLYFRHRGWLGRPPPLDENARDDGPDEAPKRPTRSRRTTARRNAVTQ